MLQQVQNYPLTVEQLDLDGTFYQLLAFVLIFLVVKFGLQLIASMFDFLKYLPVLGFVARITGALFGFIEFYILMFLVLYLAGYATDRVYSRQYK